MVIVGRQADRRTSKWHWNTRNIHMAGENIDLVGGKGNIDMRVEHKFGRHCVVMVLAFDGNSGRHGRSSSTLLMLGYDGSSA